MKINLLNQDRQYFKGAAANAAAPQRPMSGDFAVAGTMPPKDERNFYLFNKNKVEFLVSQKENSLPYITDILLNSKDEKEIIEALFILNKIADKSTKGIPAMYPVLAKFNDSQSPEIQAFLAGVYRKTQVPDAFGPLVKMLIQNSMKPKPSHADEEIGGAILEYIRNYSNNPQKIDYSA